MFLRENCPAREGEKRWLGLGGRPPGRPPAIGFPPGVRGLPEPEGTVLHADRERPPGRAPEAPFGYRVFEWRGRKGRDKG